MAERVIFRKPKLPVIFKPSTVLDQNSEDYPNIARKMD